MSHEPSASPLILGGAHTPRAALPQLPPLALYIHIPWCVRKCPYCDFNSHAASPTLPEEEYVDALLADLDQDLHAVHGRELSSIFFGGGTPSLFSAQALGRLLKGVEQRIRFAPDIEITLEANPGTFEQEKFTAYRALGINRLSIGIQSFQEQKLKALGRIHNGDEATRAAGMARQAGFDNFNLDLMHGLPDQSLDDALGDLRQAIAMKPTHLSWYQLTLEPNTVFWNQPPVLPEDDTLWDIQEAGQALLAEHGYAQYEVSAYAQPGRAARHNLNYWSFGDFIGIGAGAHGKLSHPDGRILRTWKTRLPKDYLNPAKQFKAGEKALGNEELPFEFLMNALRLTDGVDAALFAQRTGLDLVSLAEGRRQAEQSGLLQVEPSRLAATARGQLFLNDLLQYFLI
ncbi:putative oxygen-independent coproporphyrinogen III oxidase [Pseudomonas protegens]|jgi:putative oxygen-independent coproporphyrinogen III oxidase|uniref:Heme chaperone HemW n=1 Tax=Pseudomonas protegens (strain DSM 19095 / LMG 27888 / CFBP 6595 / CHA0) TaxID=1124983 RepID=A0A2C9EVL6_PSEPH|nr:radical SAM family heme chaperone HemW [Pseudomonas protegens]AGL87528.1 oxygen-independent coproporphyrinogen-III oxidase-like protein YggW [Pseudomonas protegens CHA0]MDT3423011.1 putative oxygen-independent coproporphyrinogen III oxidase [Pseudomonas protegens]RLO23162.1 radical SAM family heme chaperone HemW [Pseudomonas protegens]ROM32090.1 YggW family oxidoreductase [Pseudomonas protegens]VAV72051.1 putative coproporphyrinogen dehydrogenase [Pseudomonas protegens CHA0]